MKCPSLGIQSSPAPTWTTCSYFLTANATERGRSTQKNGDTASQQINCRVLVFINYQKAMRSTRWNQSASVPRRSRPRSGRESPTLLWWKGHPAWVPLAVTLKWKCPCAMWQLIWLLLTREAHQTRVHLLGETFWLLRPSFLFLGRSCDTAYLVFQSNYFVHQNVETWVVVFFQAHCQWLSTINSMQRPTFSWRLLSLSLSLNLIGRVKAL